MSPQTRPAVEEGEASAAGRTLGDTLRDEGMSRALAGSPEQWRLRVDVTIGQLAKVGRPFTSDDISAVTGDSPTGSRGAMGALVRAAAARGVIERVGYVASRRPALHSHPVTLWIGVGHKRNAA